MRLSKSKISDEFRAFRKPCALAILLRNALQNPEFGLSGTRPSVNEKCIDTVLAKIARKFYEKDLRQIRTLFLVNGGFARFEGLISLASFVHREVGPYPVDIGLR